ncbi:MAG: glutamine synthetase family protein [Dehalococcoidia bacterium]|jgi:glutamine synthetase|nr:glutamine synthetase family protein [Dehalococcoidia bacterium]
MVTANLDESAKEFVLRTVKEQDVKFIRLWFTDVLGALKGFSISPAQLEEALEYGIGFDGASIEGYARVGESDMVAIPDPNTFAMLPWRPQHPGVARVFADLYTPDGAPFEGDPRYVLRRNLERAAEMGFTFYVGPELEYFYFNGSDDPTPLDQGGYFDQMPLDVASDLRRETILTLEEMGIEAEYSHHEVAPGQDEIVLRYSDALTMADNCMTYRLVVKEIARQHGVYATFMPKPLADVNGSGMHTHQSLFRGEANAFYDADSPDHLSVTARNYIGGILHYAPDFTAITNQWVNSYKRLVAGFEAPVHISWARRNQSDLIRVPRIPENRPDFARIEYRAPDPACNPYLAFSVMLAAGLAGIEQGIEPPPPMEQDVFAMTDQERADLGIGSLPGSLREAIQLVEGSEFVRGVLGDHAFQSFVTNKRIEDDEYRAQVTDYEVRRYLPAL